MNPRISEAIPADDYKLKLVFTIDGLRVKRVGSHTLSVTPWDGDDCSGAAGTPVTLTFEVVEGPLGSAPPPPERLGVPGKPTIVN